MNNNKSIFCKSVLLGGLIGGLVSLFHKDTRNHMIRRASGTASKTAAFARSVRDDPERVKQQVKDTSENVKTIARDINKEIKDVVETFKEVRANSEKTYRSFKETGDELKELGTKVKRSTEEIRNDGNPGGYRPT